MKTKIALAVSLALSSSAFADDLVYQSQTLAGTASIINGSQNNSSPINDIFTITVTISGPLAPNLNNQMITPQSWIVSCQNCVEALSSNPTNNTVSPPAIYIAATAAVFLFSTDSTGKITGWNFGISGNSSVSDGMGGFISQNNGSFSSGDFGTSDQVTSAGHQYVVNTSGPAGTWSQSSLSNPAPPPPAVVSPPVITPSQSGPIGGQARRLRVYFPRNFWRG